MTLAALHGAVVLITVGTVLIGGPIAGGALIWLVPSFSRERFLTARPSGLPDSTD